MPFDPKPTKYPFPMDTGAHYLVVKKNDGTVFNADYPYLDESKKFLRKKKFARFLLYTLVWPVARIKMGLKIEGRENIKNNKELLIEGVITCSNHIHMWDYIAVMKALRPHKSYVIVWPNNMRGENKKLIKSVGGIPIPDGNFDGYKCFIGAIDKLMKEHQILHICAEGSMWEYYMPIRPFKSGVADFSVKYNKPVIPFGFSYRKPGFIRSKIFHQYAKITLKVGKPLFPNNELNIKERKKDLTTRLHDEVCRLCGIDPKDNIYPPIYNNSTRIDYY